VFSRADGAWSEAAKLTASDGDRLDQFGRSVAVSGDGSTALVGADGDENPNGEDYLDDEIPEAGSAYVFSRADGGWSEEAKLAASDGDSGDRFGRSVAVAEDGSTALIGARSDDNPNGEDAELEGVYSAGSAYVFSRTDGAWSEEAKLPGSDSVSGDWFGVSVAVAGDGSTALVGAGHDDAWWDGSSVSAYVFSRADGAWSEAAKLSPSDGDDHDGFGDSVAMAEDGSTALLGARGDEDPSGDRSGSAYVFSRADGAWSEEAKLAASDGDSGDWFGASVAVSEDGSTTLIGAGDDEDPNGDRSGSAYVFK
jgi:nucleoside-specific outer membrane channel protein Tsx